jgi:FlaA1/EpsC-like NDP-sugar epimerase
MSRTLTRAAQVSLDLLVLSLAYWLAFLFRFEFHLDRSWVDIALLNWTATVAVAYGSLVALGVPRYSWRFVSLREVTRIGLAIGLSSTILFGLRVAGQAWANVHNIFLVPLGALAMNTVLAFVALIGVRAVRRVVGERNERRRRTPEGERTRVLLVGAGAAGVVVARELNARPDLGLVAVGFVDDDPLKVGTHIAGLPVLGASADIAAIAERKRVQRVLITIANAPGPAVRAIALRCKDAGLDTKIIPGIYEIVGDQVNLSRIRDVAIEDLLGREPVQLDEIQVADSITGRLVMITGAGGSIGSEVCRQVARFGPGRLVLVERFENALFDIHRELVAAFPGVTIEPCVADLSDVPRMRRIFDGTRPDVVFHAAAHKHVPMMELNPGEAIKNNIGGTRIVADLADEFGVGQFVMISTDKAVNPTSVMGATKRVAEIYIQALAHRSKTRFVTVRFGNVLGSNGSVIPIFKEQIARGGPVTVTHPDMCRYFMTIPEASQLVLQAGAMGQGGEIFILDMGEPVKIVDLAKDLIRLSGLRPGEDIELKFTGMRPGEKLFEELSTDAEHTDKTKHPKIFIGRVDPSAYADVTSALVELLGQADDADPAALRTALAKIVPEYTAGRTTPRNDDSPSASGAHAALKKRTEPRGTPVVRIVS